MYNFAFLIQQLPNMPLIAYVGGGFLFASLFNIFFRWFS